MPLPGRSILLAAALAGAALGAVPALGARHHRRARVLAVKARAHGSVPGSLPRRPPLTGTLPGTTTPPPATDTTPATTTPAPACPTAVGVSEGNQGGTYYTRLSRSAVCAGALTVELHNDGEDDHDLKVLDLNTGTVAATWAIVHPGQSVQQRLTLPAGSYRLFCTLSDGNGSHDALGMNAILTVG